MNKYDIAGTLTTYAKKILLASNAKQIKKLVKELRKEIDLRKVED